MFVFVVLPGPRLYTRGPGLLVTDVFKQRIRAKSFFVLVHCLGTADVCLHSDFLAKIVDYLGTIVFLFLTPDWVSAEEVC